MPVLFTLNGMPPDTNGTIDHCFCSSCREIHQTVTMYASRQDDPAYFCQCELCRTIRVGIIPCNPNDRAHDTDGYDQFGYNQFGNDRDGNSHLDRFGYDLDGYDREGYNRDGYNRDGYNEDGYNRDGYNENGYNENGYNENGYNENGYNEDGYNEDGYNEDGYNENGFDQFGYNEDGYDEDGYDEDGNLYCPECGYAPCECSENGCCDSPLLDFAIRNDGCEPLANDTQITVTLPAGTISTEGLTAIRDYLYRQGERDVSWDLYELGNQWQTRAGNFAKRLSRRAYQQHQVKLTPEILSQVGCIARDHSKSVSTEIDITRELNRSAKYFYHESSCWWSSYSDSRCALKTNGGFGLRSLDSCGDATGRAWVLPLRQTDNGTLTPTFDTLTPDAFVVFNGYGDLSGYAPARIMAHMTGWTYRKIDFECTQMYINAGGYLIAPENIAENYTDGSLHLSVQQHSSLFVTEKGLVNA